MERKQQMSCFHLNCYFLFRIELFTFITGNHLDKGRFLFSLGSVLYKFYCMRGKTIRP